MKYLDKKSICTLVLANLAVLILAISEKWSLPTLLWTYWFQSIFIGIFQARKIINSQNFSGFLANSKINFSGSESKIPAAAFFLAHYNFFHALYALFLLNVPGKTDWQMIILGSTIFLVNHLFSYLSNFAEDSRKVFPGRFFLPYYRILPMQLCILIFGALVMIGLGVNNFLIGMFIILKTIADVTMHIYEHSGMDVNLTQFAFPMNFRRNRKVKVLSR